MAKKKSESKSTPVPSIEDNFRDKLALKIAARALASELARESKRVSQVANMPDYAKRVFLEETASQIGFDWGAMLTEHQIVMSDKEAEAFSRAPMGFGEYAKLPREEVRPDYLDWLADACGAFLRWYRWLEEKRTR